MIALPLGARHAARPLAVLSLGLAIVVVFSLGGTVHAGLLHSTYDIKITGHVLKNGNQSTEQYAAKNVPLEIATHTNVPNTVSPTPVPPFTATTTRVNRVTATAVGETSNPPSGLNIEFWVKGPISDSENVFVHPLDPAKLVEVELKLVLNTLQFGKKMVLNDVNLVKGVLFDAVSVQTTGTGFAGDANHPADPLVALIKYNPADVMQAGGSFLKVQFDYTTEATVIPEPATISLVGLCAVGLVGALRRRAA